MYIKKMDLRTSLVYHITRLAHISIPAYNYIMMSRPKQIGLFTTVSILFFGLMIVLIRFMILYLITGIETLHPYLLVFTIIWSAGLALTSFVRLTGIIFRRH